MRKGTKKFIKALDRFNSHKSARKLAVQAVKVYQRGKRLVNIGKGISSVTGSLSTWGIGWRFSK